MTKSDLMREILACDAEVELLQAQLRRLDERLRTVQRRRRAYLECLQHGEFDLAERIAERSTFR